MPWLRSDVVPGKLPPPVTLTVPWLVNVTPGPIFEYAQDSTQSLFEIEHYDLETGKVTTVVSGYGGSVRPTPSPDGELMAFVRRDKDQSQLWIKDLDTGEESVYTLMSGERLDIDAGHVSRDSPIGQSLFGAKSGTTVTVETPQRTRRLRILSITPPPDAPEPPPPAA